MLHLTDVSGEQIAETLTATGFEPGDAGLDIPARAQVVVATLRLVER